MTKPIFRRLFWLALLLTPTFIVLRAQDEILGIIPVGSRPVSVAVNSTTGQAFILNKGSQDVFAVDLKTRAVAARYKVGGVPESLAVNPKTNQVVVVSSKGEVTLIDHGQGKVSAVYRAGVSPSRVAIDAATNTALVTDFSGGSLLIIDLATGQTLKKIDLKNGPSGVTILEGKRQAVVACQYDMELQLIDLDRRSAEQRLLVGRYISEVAANQATGLVAVGNPSSNGILSVYDPAANAILSTLPIGAGPLSVAVYPKRNVALVAEYTSATATLVDLEVNRVIRTIPVAKGPSGVAIDPDTGVAVVVSSLADTATFIDIERIFNPPAPSPPPPPPPEALRDPQNVFLLLADPDGKVGQITVANPEGAQIINQAGLATEVADAKAAPGAPFKMPPDQISRLFGDVLAAQPARPAKFLLYFDSNSATLTAESRKLIPDIVRTIREKQSGDVSVIGHADTRGSRQFNYGLSLRRAQAVAQLLTAEGIDFKILDIGSDGKDNPRIRTKDMVAEPGNRRVEVTVR